MKAYGSKKCLHAVRVYQSGHGKKISFATGVKSKKHGRKWKE